MIFFWRDRARPLYFFLLFACFCDSALAAADFEALLVRPSVRTLDATLATFAEVALFGAWTWDNALAAAVLDLEPVLAELSVLEAAEAAFVPVVFVLAILPSKYNAS